MSESDVSGSTSTAAANKGGGCLKALIFFILLVILGGIGFNAGVGHYMENCEEGEDIVDCMFAIAEEEAEEGATTATGTYPYKDYAVTITMQIPLDGGNVTGSVSGTCDGVVKGSYDGKDNGVITGTIRGSCDPFFVKVPAKATFNGSVNKTGKTVPISFTGTGAGFSHSDSMSLSY